MEVGKKIKQLRLSRNLTLEEAGNLVGVGKSTFRKWEEGMIANMKRDKIQKLSEVFDVPPTYFLDIYDGVTDLGNNRVKLEPDGPIYTKNTIKDSYFFSEETAEMAQRLFENQDLKLLFDAAQDAKSEDLQTVRTMLLALKAKEKE